MTLTRHAQQRMTERGISRLDVHRTITSPDHRWKSKDNTIAFERGDIRVIIDPRSVAVVSVIRVSDK